MIRRLLADDQALVRGALAAMLALEPDIEVALTERLRRTLPSCWVVICTTFGRPSYFTRAMRAGASGFVAKDSSPEHLDDTCDACTRACASWTQRWRPSR
ncbi:hypothetical protein [Nonomuraea jabiensis]|uniref:DNA-binding NarL/FixJ family response regulator n=1 Tax=Nonomuraea jabiensis TaxID=882448 RepID=A0A7W9FY55_9ACTN|nr:DNA-binding NarL/FixJ family response regulator [Nonomuraea jabiensis]